MYFSINTLNALTAETKISHKRTYVRVSAMSEDLSIGIHDATEDEVRELTETHQWEAKSYDDSRWITFSMLGVSANVFISHELYEELAGVAA